MGHADDEGRPAVAHHADGVAASPPVDAAPRAFTIPTWWRTSELALVVTNDGALVVQPAFDASGSPIGVIRSDDGGAHWELVTPPDPHDPSRELKVDQDMALDRDTGRIFWVSSGYAGPATAKLPHSVSRLDMSDDGGRTWFRSSGPPTGEPVVGREQPTRDHSMVFTGAAPSSLQDRLRNYPNVVYVTQGHAPLLLGRSLDGGHTFDPPRSIPFPTGIPAPQFPMPDGTRHTTNFGLRGVVDRRGTVFVPTTPENRPYVAISDDAGDTWELVLVADVETHGYGMLSLGLDADENLFAGWVDATDRLPYLSVSRDRGRSWRAPQMVAAPGVTEAALPSLVAGAPGQVALTYYGSDNSPGPPFPPPARSLVATASPDWAEVTWNVYVTETFEGLGHHPLYWSATLNDPAHPSWYGASPSAEGRPAMHSEPWGAPRGHPVGSQPMAGNLSGHVDYYGITMAPDATPWVAYYQACIDGQPVPGNPYTQLAGGRPTDAVFAMVGCLRAPRRTPATGPASAPGTT
jgi:hypothetical protein